MVYLLVVLVVFDYVFGLLLSWLNLRHGHAAVPDELHGIYDDAGYERSRLYEKSKERLNLVSGAFSTALLVALLLTGAFGRLDDAVLQVTDHPVLRLLMFFGILAVASDLLGLPFAVYRIFFIEERFGFNRTTAKTFVLDKVKGYGLGALLGGGLLSVLIWLLHHGGTLWWLWCWLSFTVVMLAMTAFYASLVLPLFNRLTPLPAGDLRESIEAYCRRVGFGLRNLFVMDGSKRSAKANAFFSGLGPRKRIVLFDTLIRNHTTDELVAVLAHEIGHYRRRHVLTMSVVSILHMGLMLFLFSVAVGEPAFSVALGGHAVSPALGILAFGILYSPVSFLLGIVTNGLSRRHEYEADRYARDTFSGKALAEALRKLSRNNLSNLTPHPWYVFFHYSHPPLLQRLRALAS